MAGDGSSPNHSRCRPWRVIAQELATETDHQKVTELSVELNHALEEQLGKLDGIPNTSGDKRAVTPTSPWESG
jgi:hypothetical protein